MTMRVIQVGLGVRGVQWAEVMKKHPDTEIVAYVRSRVELARKQVAEWGDNTPCFRTLEEAFENVKADTVVLVTPPEAHFEEIKCAVEHHCNIICEKPLSENMNECIEMVRMADKAGLLLMAGMNFRYLACTQTYRRYIQDKVLGAAGFGHFTYIRHRDGNRHDLNKYPLVMKQPMLLEQSVHHLDLMRYCYGSDVSASPLILGVLLGPLMMMTAVFPLCCISAMACAQTISALGPPAATVCNMNGVPILKVVRCASVISSVRSSNPRRIRHLR